MADIMMKVTFSADVTSLATAVAGLCNRFESLSVVNVHQNARGKCAVMFQIILTSETLLMNQRPL
jgi:hypothetical protein